MAGRRGVNLARAFIRRKVRLFAGAWHGLAAALLVLGLFGAPAAGQTVEGSDLQWPPLPGPTLPDGVPPASDAVAGLVQDCEGCPVLVRLPDGSLMGRYPVTRREFALFAEETGFVGKGCYRRGEGLIEDADWTAPGYEQTDDHPVVCVSWDDAMAYVGWLSARTGRAFRLPTVEESTAAAAGGAVTAYWWGDEVREVCGSANVGDFSYAIAYPSDNRGPPIQCDDGFTYTAPVGSFAPNAYGLYDMNGNVWQWTGDCFKGDCSNAAFRGGGWNDPAPGTFRLGQSWGDRRVVRGFALGFRVMRSAQ